jgi:hypothetical protein
MKIPKTSGPSIHVFLSVAAAIIAAVFAPNVRAGWAAPYAGYDPVTNGIVLHLWHFDEASGSTNLSDSEGANPLTSPLPLTPTAGVKNEPIGAPTEFVKTGLPSIYAVMTNCVQTTNPSTCLLPPYITITNASGTPTSVVYNVCTNLSDFINTNSGAFTWEALVYPLASVISPPNNEEIICGDSGNAVRAWQFRFSGGSLEYNNIGAGSGNDFKAPLPSSGADAATPNNWYHVALTFTGTHPTNGDAPNVLTMYWTLADGSRTNCDVLGTFTETNMQMGIPVLAIGGSARGFPYNAVANGEGFDGYVDEVRICNVCLKSGQMIFNTNAFPEPPKIGPLATNTFIGYGKTLTFSPTVSGSQPMLFQWTQNGVPLAGQTNQTLTISNITFAANGNYELFATNTTSTFGTVGTNSNIAAVTVGAAFDELYNTGVNGDGSLATGGTIDQHWYLTRDPDPVGVIPNALVWSNGPPVSPDGSLIANGPNSIWIGSQENVSGPSGTYTFETHFLIDDGAVTNATLSGILYAFNPPGGTIVQALVNGVETNIVLSSSPLAISTSFAISTGLQAGSNVLDFVVPSALGDFRAELSGISQALPAGIPVINNQPASQAVNYGYNVMMAVVALGQPPLFYQWYSNGVAVAGASGRTLSFVATNFTSSEVVDGQFTANYQVVVSNYDGSVTSSVAQVSVNAGLSVVSAGQPIWSQTTNIVVIYSGAVDPVTGTETGNYSLNNGSILSARVVAPNEVSLTTSALTPGTSYTLTVQNVENTFGVVISPSPENVTVGIYPAATVLWVKADTGVTTDSGGVNQWNDLSGNGNNLYQQDGAPFEPLLVTNTYIDKPVIRFIGTNETFMFASDSPSLEITGDMSVFAVAEFATLAGGTNGTIVSKTQSNIPAPYDYYAGTTSLSLFRGNGTTHVAVNSFAAPGVGAPHLVDVVMQGTSVAHRLDENTNGSGVLSTTIGDTAQPLYIGTREDGHNRLTGDLAELILIGSALSSNDVASMENYLVTRYHLPLGTNSYPVFIQPPVSSTNVSLGSTLTLPALATGSGPLWYQWFDVNNSTSIVTGTTNGGVLNATLTVPNVPASLNGDQLELTISNQFGSDSVYVNINVASGAPQIVTQPLSPFFTEADSTVTNYVAALGSSPLFYQWQFNGTNLSNNGQVTGAQAPVLTIADVQAADAGDYQVIISNTYGSATSSIANLTVIGAQPLGFNSGTGWTANAGAGGVPTISSNLLTLTDGNNGETRSFFFNYPQYIGGFEASFTYQASGNKAADGITFCLQNDPRGAAAVGGGGGELAVFGITPSCELEFNIYTSSGTGLGYSLDTNGVIGMNTAPGQVSLGSGDPIDVSMYYAQGQLSLTFTDAVAQTSFSTNLVVGSLPNIVKGSTAYVGFTGADGGLNAVQTVSNFTFVSIPAESIQLSSANSLISWPGTVPGYTLQESTNLLSGTWINVTNPTIVVNGTNQVSTPVVGGNMFYRLILQSN